VRTRTTRSTHTHSPRLLRIAALFSMPLDRKREMGRARQARARAQAMELLGPRGDDSPHVHARGITLIHGASGSGKSTLLRAIARECAARWLRVRRVEMPRSAREGHPQRDHRTIVDLSRLQLATWLRTLASCGLADAALLAQRPHELSTGQAWRLAIALALARSLSLSRAPTRPTTPTILIIDELCAGLDDITARGLCRTLRRAAHDNLVIFAATSSPDRLRHALAPEREVEIISMEGKSCTGS
jgi:uncharacterized protein